MLYKIVRQSGPRWEDAANLVLSIQDAFLGHAPGGGHSLHQMKCPEAMTVTAKRRLRREAESGGFAGYSDVALEKMLVCSMSRARIITDAVLPSL